MKLVITGDCRDIANSAWVSTIDEAVAQLRSDDDVARILNFLVEHHHSSPFESVTLTFFSEDIADLHNLKIYAENQYSRVSELPFVLTIDLLNFIKVTYKNKLFGTTPWNEFASVRPELAKYVQKWGDIVPSIPEAIDDVLGNHNMSVEMISIHDVGMDSHSRATWRVSLPLSIAVQLIRHRKISANASSGRYRTLTVKMISKTDDCSEIFEKMSSNIDDYLSSADVCINKYNNFMKAAKENRDAGTITNSEYKRVREYARFILPEGRLTEMYVTMYLDDFKDNYLALRNSNHAQAEHIWIAQQMQATLEEFRKNSK